LNSSGAVILFVYLLIAISQVVLRRRTSPEKLIVKMWLYPVLSIATIAAIVAVLVQMYLQEDVRPQLLLSLLVWAVMLGLYFITRWRGGSVDSLESVSDSVPVSRVLVLANKTVTAVELLDELRSIDQMGETNYFVCVPANFVDSGMAADLTSRVWVDGATVNAARERLDHTLSTLRSEGLPIEGEFGDFLPMRALEYAVAEFHPDRIVIATFPQESSPWLHHDVIQRARQAYPAIPLTHVIARLPTTAP
jgi:GABA permease